MLVVVVVVVRSSISSCRIHAGYFIDMRGGANVYRGSSLYQVVQIQVLARATALFSRARNLTLTMPFSLQVYMLWFEFISGLIFVKPV